MLQVARALLKKVARIPVLVEEHGPPAGTQSPAPVVLGQRRVRGDVIAERAQIIHELSPGDRLRVVARHALHQVLDDVGAGQHRGAMGEETAQFLRVHYAVPVAVHAVPTFLQLLLEDGAVVGGAHLSAMNALLFGTNAVCARVVASGASGRGLLAPHVEEHLGAEVRDAGVRHLAAEDIHKPIGRVLVVGHREPQALEVGLRAQRRTEVHGLPALAQQEDVVEQREQRVPRLVDDHDARHTELAHLLQRQRHGQRARGVQA
mmetsp:Transcript_91184/g.279149  ORF Transcript_91184/g.279149 Transcript_91184/m.279149 type:complete len:262 (-) Transcript_91184:720-1505(-)